MATDSTPNCRTCGACCTSPTNVTFAMPITRAEARRLPRYVVGGDIQTEGLPQHKRSLRQHPTLPRCAALHGVPGQSCTCRVYENRPEVCRVFPVGGPHCLAARAQAGIQ